VVADGSFVHKFIGCGCDATEHLLREARRLIALSERHKLGGFRAHGMALLGWAQCQRGDMEQGIALTAKAVKAFEAADYRLGVAGYLANMADAQRQSGRPFEAKASSARAIAMMLDSGNGWLEPELRRIDALTEGELSPGNRGPAQDMLRKAAERAREMGFALFERRCLLSLRDSGGAGRQDPEIESRLRTLAHLDNLKDLVGSTFASADAISSP
jgi:predicted ATPase